uniref:Uncharacterized protein n=1 Tax=Manihot esculenta TaxID=3983 RepID=A0A2C9UCA3_MANES
MPLGESLALASNEQRDRPSDQSVLIFSECRSRAQRLHLEFDYFKIAGENRCAIPIDRTCLRDATDFETYSSLHRSVLLLGLWYLSIPSP